MPFIMGLEGPRPTLLGAAHGELLAAVPRPFWRAGSKLSTLVRSAGDPKCCWNCSCESNPCCDGYTGASPSRTLRGPDVGRWFRKLFERIPGGRASGMGPTQFDSEQLAIGQRVEMEHTRDPRIAREIAMDHLAEDVTYYTKLRTVHLDGLTSSSNQKWFILGGILLGGWLAGSTRGQALVRKYKPRRK